MGIINNSDLSVKVGLYKNKWNSNADGKDGAHKTNGVEGSLTVNTTFKPDGLLGVWGTGAYTSENSVDNKVKRDGTTDNIDEELTSPGGTRLAEAKEKYPKYDILDAKGGRAELGLSFNIADFLKVRPGLYLEGASTKGDFTRANVDGNLSGSEKAKGYQGFGGAIYTDLMLPKKWSINPKNSGINITPVLTLGVRGGGRGERYLLDTNESPKEVKASVNRSKGTNFAYGGAVGLMLRSQGCEKGVELTAEEIALRDKLNADITKEGGLLEKYKERNGAELATPESIKWEWISPEGTDGKLLALVGEKDGQKVVLTDYFKDSQVLKDQHADPAILDMGNNNGKAAIEPTAAKFLILAGAKTEHIRDEYVDKPKRVAFDIYSWWARIQDKVQFDFDKSDLRVEAKQVLTTAATELKGILAANPDLTLKAELHGHTDSKGTDTYNQGLSERRAASVLEFLNTLGIPTTFIRASRGFGETKPIDTNSTQEGRDKNRRVEIHLFEGDKEINPNGVAEPSPVELNTFNEQVKAGTRTAYYETYNFQVKDAFKTEAFGTNYQALDASKCVKPDKADDDADTGGSVTPGESGAATTTHNTEYYITSGEKPYNFDEAYTPVKDSIDQRITATQNVIDSTAATPAEKAEAITAARTVVKTAVEAHGIGETVASIDATINELTQLARDAKADKARRFRHPDLVALDVTSQDQYVAMVNSAIDSLRSLKAQIEKIDALEAKSRESDAVVEVVIPSHSGTGGSGRGTGTGRSGSGSGAGAGSGTGAGGGTTTTPGIPAI